MGRARCGHTRDFAGRTCATLQHLADYSQGLATDSTPPMAVITLTASPAGPIAAQMACTAPGPSETASADWQYGTHTSYSSSVISRARTTSSAFDSVDKSGRRSDCCFGLDRGCFLSREAVGAHRQAHGLAQLGFVLRACIVGVRHVLGHTWVVTEIGLIDRGGGGTGHTSTHNTGATKVGCTSSHPNCRIPLAGPR